MAGQGSLTSQPPSKIKTIELSGEESSLKVQIWDGGRGDKKFSTIRDSYIAGQHPTYSCPLLDGLMLVYDVADRTSFESIREQVGRWPSDTTWILVGNKCGKQVKSDQITRANQYQLPQQMFPRRDEKSRVMRGRS